MLLNILQKFHSNSIFSFNFTYQTFCSYTINFLFIYAPIIKSFSTATSSCIILLAVLAYCFPQEENSSLPVDFYLLTGKLSKLSEKHMYLPATCITYHKSSATDHNHRAHLKCLATCFENELVTKSPGVCWHCCCHRSEALKSKGASNPSAQQQVRLENSFHLEEAGSAAPCS